MDPVNRLPFCGTACGPPAEGKRDRSESSDEYSESSYEKRNREEFGTCFSCHGLAEGGIQSEGPLLVCSDCGACPKCGEEFGVFDQTTHVITCGCGNSYKIPSYEEQSRRKGK